MLEREHEHELGGELVFGPRVVLARAVIADAFEVYLAKPRCREATRSRGAFRRVEQELRRQMG